MAFTWAINPVTGDMQINSNGRLQIVYGAEEVRQRIIIALQHYYMEYFLNIPGGVPWHELILGSKDKSLAEALIRRTVLGVPNVNSILSFQSTFSNRILTLYMSVEVTGADGSVYVVVVKTSTNGAYFTFEDGSIIMFDGGPRVDI